VLVVEVVVGGIGVIYDDMMSVGLVIVLVIMTMGTKPSILFLMKISFRDLELVRCRLQDARCGRCRAIESNAARLHGKTSALEISSLVSFHLDPLRPTCDQPPGCC
jgi:hypothetical protein